MHKGTTVFATRGGKKYHLKDDDCGVASSIMKGRTLAEEIEEDEALSRGLSLCQTCQKELHEDLRGRGIRTRVEKVSDIPQSQAATGCLVFIVPIIGVITSGLFLL